MSPSAGVLKTAVWAFDSSLVLDLISGPKERYPVAKDAMIDSDGARSYGCSVAAALYCTVLVGGGSNPSALGLSHTVA